MKLVSIFLNDYQFYVNPHDIQVIRKPRETEVETATGVVIQFNPNFKEEPIGLTISGRCNENQLKSIGNIFQQYLNDHKPIKYVCNYYLQNWNIRPTQWTHTRATRYTGGWVEYTFTAKVVEVSYDYGRQVLTPIANPWEKETTYTVKVGDTLWLIAQNFYGDGAKWTLIANYSKNQGKINENGSVNPGTVLYIPFQSLAGGSARPAAAR